MKPIHSFGCAFVSSSAVLYCAPHISGRKKGGHGRRGDIRVRFLISYQIYLTDSEYILENRKSKDMRNQNVN